VLLVILCGASVRAQLPAAGSPPRMPVTREAAVAAALQHGTAAALGRADTAVAGAQLAVARALPNPVLAGSYSRSAPQLRASIDLPLDVPWLRRLRVAGAAAGHAAATLQFAYTRATARYDVEVAYGAALAAGERARLSAEAARDADSLHTLARRLRDAGAASDLDVELAAINADQQANAATADTLAAVGALLDLQALMGMPADAPRIALADSLPALLAGLPAWSPGSSLAAGDRAGAAEPVGGDRQAPPLAVAAAQATYQSQDLALRLARRRSAVVPSLQLGVEGRDPTGGPQGVLPVVGLAVPLPIFNRYRGDVALAEANRLRAAVELANARRTTVAAIARARRELAVAEARLARDRRLLATARVVSAKSVTAYTEGAAALADVLQAQRVARDAYAQYVADAIATTNAAAAVRLTTASASP
jgi:cobalt-zinc-cadmium efflux system outer membrane protein